MYAALTSGALYPIVPRGSTLAYLIIQFNVPLIVVDSQGLLLMNQNLLFVQETFFVGSYNITLHYIDRSS